MSSRLPETSYLYEISDQLDGILSLQILSLNGAKILCPPTLYFSLYLPSAGIKGTSLSYAGIKGMILPSGRIKAIFKQEQSAMPRLSCDLTPTD
ncbi:hypothetical protein STEG23_017135, partial [Scotinomys teguina]